MSGTGSSPRRERRVKMSVPSRLIRANALRSSCKNLVGELSVRAGRSSQSHFSKTLLIRPNEGAGIWRPSAEEPRRFGRSHLVQTAQFLSTVQTLLHDDAADNRIESSARNASST